MQPQVETVGVNLHSFFAGLLPEGLRFEALLHASKTSADDLFSLLLAAGTEAIGDVRVMAVGEGGVIGGPAPVVTANRFEALSFKSILANSLDYPRSPERHLLPGVQPKISAQMVTLPIDVTGQPHAGAALLKLEPTNLPRLIHNEAFFMQAATACGLEVASTTLVFDRDQVPGLLVRRFDRRPKAPFRLHVEDGCQLLNRYPADKYRVSFQDLARVVAELTSAPTLELARLLELLAFSYLIANGDLHARNVSLFVSSDSRIRLSPAYDLLSTLPYGDRRLALKVLGRDDHLKRSHFVQLANQFDLRPRAVEQMLDGLIERLMPWVERLDEIGLDHKKTATLRKLMTTRAEALAKPTRSN